MTAKLGQYRTPKLEEVAAAIEQEIFNAAQMKASLTRSDIAAILRPFFPPANTPGIAEHVLNEIVLAVCEIPDRTSPDDFPEAMLVTPEELKFIIRDKFEQAATPSSTLHDLERDYLRNYNGHFCQEHVGDYAICCCWEVEPDSELRHKCPICRAEKAEDEIRQQKLATTVSTGEANGWVSVEERLPKSGAVLVYAGSLPLSIGYYRNEVWLDQETIYEDPLDRKPIEVTHWHPLPALPTQPQDSVPQAHVHNFDANGICVKGGCGAAQAEPREKK